MSSRLRRAARVLVAVAPLLAPPPGAAAPQVELTAELAPDPVGLDETVTLTLVATASGLGMPELAPGFLLDNLEGSSGAVRSQNMSWINGRTTVQLRLVWQLRPLEVGTARVHQIRVELDGEVRALPDLEVEVVHEAPPGRAAPPRGAPADPFRDFFDDETFGFSRRRPAAPATRAKVILRALAEPAEAWAGQQIVWRLMLDTQTDVSGFRPRALPDFAGFWAREVPLPDRPRPEWVDVDGERFGRVTMTARALFPLRAGEFVIPAVEADIVARQVEVDWFGGLGRDEPLRRASSPVSVRVRALPPPPAGFSGVVGALTLAARLEPPEIAAGQAATLVVTAAGDGNLRALTVPALALPDGLRGFPPSTASREEVDAGRLRTTVEWRYVLLADRPQAFVVPALELVHFDPARGEYAIARGAPVTLAVRPGSAAPLPAATSPPAPELAAPPESGDRGGRRVALAAAALAVALLVAAARYLAGRRERGLAARELARAVAAARAEATPRAAARALDAAWRRFLAERYAVPRSLPLAQWHQPLAARGVDAVAIAELHEFVEELHLLEFAPELSDAAALRDDLFARSPRLLRRLR